ncbi:MAG TPA: cytochrome c biogenesis protein CcsA [Candidatus Deferrimicrobiaceae bacterium]|nr:cytochrome c biogenesis protein CcsA [Candidatus Deferrimicrobiaceae bacterium]
MQGAHLVLFWLTLVAYATESGLQLGGITPKSPYRSALFGGLLLHSLFLGLRWGLSGHAPMAGLFDSLTVFSFCSALSAFLLCGTPETMPAWRILSALVVLPQAGAALLDKRLTPLYPALDTPWFAAHVGLSFLGYGFFAAGLALSWTYLRRGGEEVYRAAGSSALYGFTAFSAGMVCGGIWAFYAWGSYWIWTPKEIWSVVLWVYFAVLTHLKFIPAGEGWPRWGRRLEMGATAVGYFVMLATFLGVSLLLRSSHSF